MIKNLEVEENFDNEVKIEGKVLVDFYAEWCGPCRMTAPLLEQISQEHEDANILKVDVDANQQVAMKYEVMSIPTFVLFENGEPVDKKMGLMAKDELEKFMRLS